jgi:LIM homeobox protein 2/9
MEGYDSSSSTCPGGMSSGQQRTKRMRTSFKHHQLRTMKSYFAINQNPDAKDLKQLAQKTGLSKRVLQVKIAQSMMDQNGMLFSIAGRSVFFFIDECF